MSSTSEVTIGGLVGTRWKPALSVEVTDGIAIITFDLPKSPSMIQTVVFHYKAGSAGDVNRKLQIKTDLATDSAVSIKVEGAVGP